ncbi:MAG: Ig-like domain-containing protein, partial [Acidobacteriota bacterium]
FTPQPLAFLDLPGDARNVDVMGDHVAVACGAAGLCIVDVADPSAPALIATLNTPGTAEDVRWIGDRAFVADGSGGLRIVDLTNPAAPVELGALALAGYAEDVAVAGDLVFVAAGAAGVHGVDAQDPALPVARVVIDTAGFARGVDYDATTGLLATADGGEGLRLDDLSQLTSPVFLGALDTGNARDVVLRRGTAFVADRDEGLVAVDVSDPAAPVAGPSLPPAQDGLLEDVAVAGPYAFGADIFFVNGVPIVDIAEPTQPNLRAVVDFSQYRDDNGSGIAVDARFVYLTAEDRLYVGQYFDTVDDAGLAPEVDLVRPADGTQILLGTVATLEAEAVDDVAVATVRFLVDGQEVFADAVPPYAVGLPLPSAPMDLTLQAVAEDFAGNTASSSEVTLVVSSDFTPPTFDAVTPADGFVLRSGDLLQASATVSDDTAVARVVFRWDGREVEDTVSPFEASFLAPRVDTAEIRDLEIEAYDLEGNRADLVRGGTVEPSLDATPPTATWIRPSNAGAAVAGSPVDLVFELRDDISIDRWTLDVDGARLADDAFVGTTAVDRTVTFDVPAGTPGGTLIPIRLEVYDFAGGAASVDTSLRVVVGDLLVGNQTLDATFDGRSLVLGAGTHTVVEPIQLAELTLLDGAELTAPIDAALGYALLEVTVAGNFDIGFGSIVDLEALGYRGGHSGHPDGYAPDGILPSSPDAGGSHGGVGIDWNGPGPAGEVYGSVYLPHHAGGGGGRDNDGSGDGTSGGGVAILDAGTLVVDGEILALGGASGFNSSRAPGAGGSVQIHTGTLRGTGRISVSGRSSNTNLTTGAMVGASGGGRIAIWADVLDGFDPEAELRATGGRRDTASDYAGPGTMLVKTAADSYGRLYVDNREDSGSDRPSAPIPLPALGGGAVTTFTPDGTDAWLEAAEALRPRWIGAFVRLSAADGADLGVYPVIELDGAGRLRLAGAGALAAPSVYAGEYRFDLLELRNGARISATDPVYATTIDIDGATRIPSVLSGVDMRVRDGGVARPATDEPLVLDLSGTLTVEAGGRVDVAGYGYLGGREGAVDGDAPDGLVGASPDAGGSHGGIGVRWNAGAGGEVYGSVYRPTLPGGGGSQDNDGDGDGTRGGGVFILNVDVLDLEGEIRVGAQASSFNSSRAGGAGGSFLGSVGTARGGGLIDVSGATTGTNFSTGRFVGPGGGGRASLFVETLDGFDPDAQIRAWGGRRDTASDWGGPGTVLVRRPGELYGRLIVDSGEDGGVDRVGPISPLPELGTGGVVALTASGADAWVEADRQLRERWVGAGMRLLDSGGVDLGLFRVLDLGADGRVLLEGAGAVVGAITFAGEYRFDAIDLRNGARIDAVDPVHVETVTVESGDTRIPASLDAHDVTLRSGAVARPATDGVAHLRLTGTLTVETGARLDASGLGYLGGRAGAVDGDAPEWVTGSAPDAGGSHGGVGRGADGGGAPGEVYGSVYVPTLGGGGGSRDDDNSGDGTRGGGVLVIEAADVVLDGEIRVRSDASNFNSSRPAGAGGSLRIHAQTLSGSGFATVSGRSTGTNFTFNHDVGPGAGGRAALYVDAFVGFDPDTQVRSIGGRRDSDNAWAGPGTIFVKTLGATYGRLVVDNGEESDGTDRIGPVSPLPELGAGAVTSVTAEGGDARIAVDRTLRPRWLGAWMRLDDASGVELGTFRVLDIGADGRALLEGAGSAASGATAFSGEYRFDRVDLRHGARIDTTDPIFADVFEVAGDTRIPASLDAGDLVVSAGAVAKPASGGTLNLRIARTLRIDAGGVLDVSGLGYLGGRSGNVEGDAPGWVVPSSPDAGGSHGGRGRRWNGPGPAGDTYDSVYVPSLWGGGGGRDEDGSGDGTQGGGLLILDVGTLELEGQIRARGQTSGFNSSRPAGAGGSVQLYAGTVRGTGLIDLSSSDTGTNFSSGRFVGPGGGGRAALYVDLFDGFDPAVQVRARGGRRDTDNTWGDPGTVFVLQPGDTHGRLIVDNGSGRGAGTTDLPSLGRWSVTATEVDGDDLWITVTSPLTTRWIGTWPELLDAADTPLGSFAVTGLDAAGRVRLAGAATVVGIAEIEGTYRFDTLERPNGAVVTATDPLLVP